MGQVVPLGWTAWVQSKWAGGDVTAAGGQDYLDFKSEIFDRVSRLVYARGLDESVPLSNNKNNILSIGTTLSCKQLIYLRFLIGIRVRGATTTFSPTTTGAHISLMPLEEMSGASKPTGIFFSVNGDSTEKDFFLAHTGLFVYLCTHRSGFCLWFWAL